MTPEAVFAGLVERGIPPHVAAGIVPNLVDESGLDPGINEVSPLVPGSRGGFGLAQWTGPRRDALEAFAAERGAPVSDPDLQLDFLLTELQGPERSAYQRILATSSPQEAAAAFATDFLRPSKANLDRRVAEYLGGDGLGEPLTGNALAGYGGMTPEMLNALTARPEPPRPQFAASPLSLDPTLRTSLFG